MGGSVWDFVAPVAGAALGSVVPGVGTGIGAAIGSGLASGVQSGSPLAGLASAGGSYLGSNLGSSLLGNTLGGTVGSGLSDAGLGFVGNVLPEALSGASLAGTLGGTLGSTLGESLVGPSAQSSGDNAAAPFSPQRESELNLPGSLSGFSGLSPIQLGSNIATQGVYGGGQGQGEQDYFLNMVNRRLVDDAGAVDSDFGEFAPIETSYLEQLGYGQKTPKDLLQALSGRFG